MCHRRGDWSRTASGVSESEDEPDEERAPWVARARERLATFVPTGREESESTTDETPERPTVKAEPTTAEGGNPEEIEDEREEDPIPADD